MRFGHVPVIALLLCLMSAGLSSCLARRRVISGRGCNPTPTLLVADQASLVAAVARQYNAIHDFNATVDMAPAVGSAEKSQITEFKDVRAFILFRKPAFIRIIGLYPVVRSKAFDMVSDGTDFRLYLPGKNRFLVGRNESWKLPPRTSSKTSAPSTSWMPCWCGPWTPLTTK